MPRLGPFLMAFPKMEQKFSAARLVVTVINKSFVEGCGCRQVCWRSFFLSKLMNKCSLSDSYKHSDNMNLCLEIVYVNRKYPLEGFLRCGTRTLSSRVLRMKLKMWDGAGGSRVQHREGSAAWSKCSGTAKNCELTPFLTSMLCMDDTTVYVSQRPGSDHCSSLVFPDPRGVASREGSLIALLSFYLFSFKPLVKVFKRIVTFGQSWLRCRGQNQNSFLCQQRDCMI